MTAVPFVKDFAFDYGRPDRLSPLVRRVICKNPGPFTFTGTGTYIVGRDEGPLAVIDPGPSDEAHLNALAGAIGDAQVDRILITHTHKDHCGGAREFADCVCAPVYGAGPHPGGGRAERESPLEEGADHGFNPDLLLKDGDRISGEGWTIETVATPGHLSNHLCFALQEEKTLFTGDHVMGWSTTVVAPPDGDMGDYLASLEKLLARDDVRYLPTHGAPIERPKPFVRAIRTHRLMRDAQIIEQIRHGRARIQEMVPRIYVDIDKRLHGAAALNVLAHLVRLVRIGVVGCNGAPSIESEFSIADAP